MFTLASILVAILNPLLISYLEKYYWTEKQVVAASVMLAFVTQLILTGLLHLFAQTPLVLSEEAITNYLERSFMMVGVQRVAGIYWADQPSVKALRQSNQPEHDV